MKTVLIIGMGKFGHHLCNRLVDLGNQVMVVDEQEERLEDVLPYVTSAKIGDCTKTEVLKSLGVGNFDYCFICIGSNFQSSLEITSLVKEMGAQYVISKAVRDIQAKFLLRNGADEVIYPDRDIAERLAARCSASHVFDYIELSKDVSIYEIPLLEEWVGKSLRTLDMRAKHKVNVLGTKNGKRADFMIHADYIFQKGDHLIVMGRNGDVQQILKQMDV